MNRKTLIVAAFIEKGRISFDKTLITISYIGQEQLSMFYALSPALAALKNNRSLGVNKCRSISQVGSVSCFLCVAKFLNNFIF